MNLQDSRYLPVAADVEGLPVRVEPLADLCHGFQRLEEIGDGGKEFHDVLTRPRRRESFTPTTLRMWPFEKNSHLPEL
jgi:hypothetical protein